MAINDFDSLKAAVSAWMLRTNSDSVVTQAQIGNYVGLCESELNRELRIRELEDTEAVTTVPAQAWVELPAGFKKIGSLEFDDKPFDMDFLTRRQLKEQYGGQSGRPRAFTVYGNRIYFGPTPDAAYTMTLDFYTAITALSESQQTNDILTNFPDIYLYGALKHAYFQVKDTENADAVGQNYNAIIDRVKQADVESRMPTKLVMKARNTIG
ncbi:MAG: hypothetical protein E6Q97_09295 [Desulfurellales bacterium]|nr:MAG: hypothetical protein E6Q97_09295 [Desulfurellales bacterium]